MTNQTMLEKTIELQKTAFVTTISIISTMQQHGEDLLKTSLEQNPWLQDSSKRACLDITNFYSKYWANFKSATDQGFEVIEKISSTGTKPEVKVSKPTKAAEKTSSQRAAKKTPTAKKKTARGPKTGKAQPLTKKKQADENVLSGKQSPDKQPIEKKSDQAKPVETKPVETKAEKPIDTTSSPSKKKAPSVSGKNAPTETQPSIKQSVEKKSEQAKPVENKAEKPVGKTSSSSPGQRKTPLS